MTAISPAIAALARAAATLVLTVAATTLAAAPAEYSISPLRIDLDRNARSSAVTLINTGTDPLDFQISVMEWTQDAQGRDSYTPSAEIVFFPKILTLKPTETRVIRIGAQSIPAKTERTFRIFVEPIPARSQDPLPQGATVSVNMRFALPIFVKPPAIDAAGEIDDAVLERGTLTLALRNKGNEHLRFDDGASLIGRDAQGREILSQRLDVRYLLPGSAKPLTFTVPKDVCAQLVDLEITARAEQLTLNRHLAATRASCE